MAYVTVHGIKSAEGVMWTGHKYKLHPYVSIKLIEESGSDITLFIDTVEQLDMIIDSLQSVRQELAQALGAKDESVGTDPK
jgi:hypothetical protein